MLRNRDEVSAIGENPGTLGVDTPTFVAEAAISPRKSQ